MSTPTPTIAGVPQDAPPKLEKKPVKFSNLLREFHPKLPIGILS